MSVPSFSSVVAFLHSNAHLRWGPARRDVPSPTLIVWDPVADRQIDMEIDMPPFARAMYPLARFGISVARGGAWLGVTNRREVKRSGGNTGGATLSALRSALDRGRGMGKWEGRAS